MQRKPNDSPIASLYSPWNETQGGFFTCLESQKREEFFLRGGSEKRHLSASKQKTGEDPGKKSNQPGRDATAEEPLVRENYRREKDNHKSEGI